MLTSDVSLVGTCQGAADTDAGTSIIIENSFRAGKVVKKAISHERDCRTRLLQASQTTERVSSV